MEKSTDNKVRDVFEKIIADYKDERVIDKIDTHMHPNKNTIIDIIIKFQYVMFPGYFSRKELKTYNMKYQLAATMEDIFYNLDIQVCCALMYKDIKETRSSQDITLEFFEKIPKIREYLESDVQAAYEGDPAAYNRDEIIFSYPGIFAIMTNRIAHELHLLGVPLIPRIMTEYAHSITGIDIHPGATLGKYFFIDHGTGIVIGETTTIGDHVKIYQGVTLGAMSTRGGQSLKGVKRHPTIEDDVTIYSGASILGGDTVVGHGVVIGSNAFVTATVPSKTKVSARNPELHFDKSNKK